MTSARSIKALLKPEISVGAIAPEMLSRQTIPEDRTHPIESNHYDCRQDDWRFDTSSLITRIHGSVAEIDRAAWNMLYPSNPECWAHYRAIERMPSDNFTYSAVAAYAGGRLVGAAPMFRVDYRLDDPLGPRFKAVTAWIGRRAPQSTRMPVLGLGSPWSDECHVGILPCLDDQQRSEVFEGLLAAITECAAANNVRVLALKDVTDDDSHWAKGVLKKHQLSAIPSLPVATLDLPFSSTDEYLASLSPNMRKDLRSKMRKAKSVRIEFRDSIKGLEADILRLYKQTQENRKASYDCFDVLPDSYFQHMMEGLEGRAKLLLCWIGDRLGLVNLFIVENDRVVGKYLGMDYEVSRKNNLYFVNWMSTVNYCIENGISSMQVGQSCYGPKARLGCKLHRSWIYAKHTGTFVGPIVRAMSRFAAFDKMDPDLREMGEDAPYATAMNQPV